MRNVIVPAIVNILEELVILLFGAPNRTLTDNGARFGSRIFANLLREYNIQHSYAALYHPQSNPVERVHRTIKNMLASYVNDNHRTWDKFLPKVGWAVKSAKHEVTGVTQNFVMYGRELNISGTSNPSEISADRDFCLPNESLLQLYRHTIFAAVMSSLT